MQRDDLGRLRGLCGFGGGEDGGSIARHTKGCADLKHRRLQADLDLGLLATFGFDRGNDLLFGRSRIKAEQLGQFCHERHGSLLIEGNQPREVWIVDEAGAQDAAKGLVFVMGDDGRDRAVSVACDQNTARTGPLDPAPDAIVAGLHLDNPAARRGGQALRCGQISRMVFVDG